PNPSTDKVEVVLYTAQEKVITVRLISSMGSQVFEKGWPVHEGINRLPIDVAQFAKGVYFVTLENGPEVSKLRLVKE
ncbi:MAG: T9SS type A sorting domain-containing protein, partial [Bacteroidia bacterium]|nr:T9SS type A sorting domain-containing protein [Bacteroidia bacterium]